MTVTSLTAGLVAPITLGCGAGSERSVEAFCETLRSEKQRILEQFDTTTQVGQASGDEFIALVAALGGSLQALGEIETYATKLARVAPAEIQTEAELVRDAISEQLDGVGNVASNPLQALGAALITSLLSSGPTNTVHRYALEHCGEGL